MVNKSMKKFLSAFIYTILLLLACIFLAPMLYALYNSLLPLKYVDKIVSFDKFTIDNYITLFTKYNVGRWYINTIVMTLITVVGNVVFNSMAGYALAKMNFPGKNFIFIIVLATMMIPFQMIITPLYVMVAKLNWHNTMIGLTVPFLWNALYIFMFRQFFMTIPNDMEEAAKIDGLTKAGTFIRIILPISGAIVATIIILNFTQSWNAYIVPATFTSSKEMYVLVTGLNTVKDLFFDRTNLTMAGVMLTTLPVLLVFLRLQKFFIQGIATSGLKS